MTEHSNLPEQADAWDREGEAPTAQPPGPDADPAAEAVLDGIPEAGQLEGKETEATPAAQNPDGGEAAPASPVRGGRDFLVSASAAAQMATERLQRKTTPATFRRMVINGEAPAPEEEDDTTAKWSQNTLDAWLDALVANAEAAPGGEDGTLVSPDGKDFYLSAAEAAALLGEAQGEKVSTAVFRRMVINGEAPEADVKAGGVPRWSQTVLDAWAAERPGTGGPLPDRREGTGFVLTVSEAVALVAEDAQPVSASRWRSLVMSGAAPAPLGWEPPRWDFAAVEAWISQALEAGILKPAPKTAPGEVQEPELVYGSTAEWVGKFLIPVYRRQLSNNGDRTTWCPAWWKHGEAIIRLEALWRAWEHLRLDGRTGMSVWLKDHLDHHLPVLTDAASGPFNGCLPARHGESPLEEFQLMAPPPALFPDVRNPKEEGARKP